MTEPQMTESELRNLNVQKIAVTIGDGVNDFAEVEHPFGREVLVTVFDAEGYTRKPALVLSEGKVRVENRLFDVARGEWVSAGPIPKDGWRVVVFG